MSRPPNVVIFLTDQQRHDTSGLHGCPLDLTPNFDAWATRGTHLATAVTPQPVCGPARACLQTGRFATAVGDGCHTNNRPLPPEADSLAKRFAHAGYATAYFGKWHLAPGDSAGPVAPEHRGGYETWLAANTLESTSDAYDTRLYDANGDEHRLPGYRVDAVTDAAIRELARLAKADRPFLCMVSHLEPHMQNHRDDHPAPAFCSSRYTGRWTPPDLAALPGHHPAVRHLVGGNAQQALAGYFGMCRRLDDAFGRLMDALISLGLLDDTIVAFASDHGCHFRTRNDEYKRSCHEASVRTPCMIHGGPFTGGGRIDRPFQLTDLAPTLCGAANIDPPGGAHGHDLTRWLQGETDWPTSAFVQVSESVCGRAVRTSRWKFGVEAPGVDPAARHAGRYVETHLYDLVSDPYELINLAGSEPHEPVRRELVAELSRRMDAAGEPPRELELCDPSDPPPPQHFQRELRESDALLDPTRL